VPVLLEEGAIVDIDLPRRRRESTSSTPSSATASPPDPAWRTLYVAGGISAWLYVLLAVVVSGVMTAMVDDFWDILVDGHRLLEFIGDGHEAYWHVLQALVLMPSILVIVTFAATTVALWRVDRSLALIGGLVGVVSQILFMAYYPVLLGMVYLAGEYEDADVGRQRDLATAAEALIAQNSGFNPVYEVLMAAGALVLAPAMLRGPFTRWAAYLGVASFVTVVAGVALHPVLGLVYLFWWAVFVLWLVVVGRDLVRLGRGRVTDGRDISQVH
jgi:hypothetical protein